MNDDYKTTFVEPAQTVAVADVGEAPSEEGISAPEARADHDVGWAFAALRDRLAFPVVEARKRGPKSFSPACRTCRRRSLQCCSEYSRRTPDHRGSACWSRRERRRWNGEQHFQEKCG